MGKKKKLKLEDIKVQSFVTSQKKSTTAGQEQEGITGNCLSFIGITCPDPNCDFKSIPLDECSFSCGDTCAFTCPWERCTNCTKCM